MLKPEPLKIFGHVGIFKYLLGLFFKKIQIGIPCGKMGKDQLKK